MSECENQSVGSHEKSNRNNWLKVTSLNKNYKSGPWPGKGWGDWMTRLDENHLDFNKKNETSPVLVELVIWGPEMVFTMRKKIMKSQNIIS